MRVSPMESETDDYGVYEAIVPYPSGNSTLSRLAKTAAASGYDGLVLRLHPDSASEGEIAETIHSLSDKTRDGNEGSVGTVDQFLDDELYGVDIVSGVELGPGSPAEIGGSVTAWRNRTTLVIVSGGTPARNRTALEDPRVDVLAQPFGESGSGDVNHVQLKAAADNDVAIECNLAPVLRSSGGPRVQALKRLRKLRELVTHYEAPLVVSARAESHLQVRGPRELTAVGEQIGFERDTILQGLERWDVIARRNRRRHGESFIGEGIKRGRYETDN